MVFQSYALYPHMTVRDNLQFGLRMRRMPAAEISERVQQAAALLGIEELLDRRPRQLSGGQRQRVAMGRAIVRRPAVFLFDEPLSNLDAKLRGRMRTELSRLHARLRTTTVYVTHDQVEAMTLADRIVVMNRGLVQQVGSPLELYQRPANRFVAGFIGTPAMNFIDGRLGHRGDRLAFVSDGLELPLPADLADRLTVHALKTQDVALGIRPTDLTLSPDSAFTTDALRARVEVREPLGAEVYLHLASSCGDLVARVDARSELREGDPVRVELPAAQLHLFDTLTETSLL
jgi:multiple sugar transport system ATP-binding protein